MNKIMFVCTVLAIVCFNIALVENYRLGKELKTYKASTRILADQVKLLEARPLDSGCAAWWFGHGDVLKLRGQICGRGK